MKNDWGVLLKRIIWIRVGRRGRGGRGEEVEGRVVREIRADVWMRGERRGQGGTRRRIREAEEG